MTPRRLVFVLSGLGLLCSASAFALAHNGRPGAAGMGILLLIVSFATIGGAY